MSAETVAKAFFEQWVSRFGCPVSVITDQGTQFQSELFNEFANKCGIKLKRTTAYHPQCNGKIERFHRTLKAALKAKMEKDRWIDELPTVLLGIRGSLNEQNVTVAEMLYGTTLRLPGDFFNCSNLNSNASKYNKSEFIKKLKNQMNSLKPVEVLHKNKMKPFVHKDLKTSKQVFVRIDRVRKTMEKPYNGPFAVIEKCDKYFTLNIKNKPTNISIDRLKPAYTLSEENFGNADNKINNGNKNLFNQNENEQKSKEEIINNNPTHNQDGTELTQVSDHNITFRPKSILRQPFSRSGRKINLPVRFQ